MGPPVTRWPEDTTDVQKVTELTRLTAGVRQETAVWSPLRVVTLRE